MTTRFPLIALLASVAVLAGCATTGSTPVAPEPETIHGSDSEAFIAIAPDRTPVPTYVPASVTPGAYPAPPPPTDYEVVDSRVRRPARAPCTPACKPACKPACRPLLQVPC